MRALVAGAVLTIALYASWRVWWGGYSFGYRLLSEVALPLVVLVAWDWPRIRASRIGMPLFAVAAALSIFVHALGAYQYPNKFDASVAADPVRLWDPIDTELTLRVRRILGPLEDRADARLVPWLRDAPVPDERWWSGETRDDAMPHALDTPHDREIVRGPLRVTGWARPSASDPGEVLVSVDPGDRRLIAPRVPRPDLDPGPDSRSFGFEVELAPRPRLEAATVLVEIRDAHGRVGRLGPVRVLWGPAR
jgi:hypothetical protein